jgi:inner membrane protein
VDALSHTLIIVILFLTAGGTPSLLPFAIIGAVIVDADIVFRIVSDRSPQLYMFTHGGFAHSIVGSVVLSGLATIGILLAYLAGIIPALALTIPLALSFFVILAGALIHLGIDVLAYPGIPLGYPLSDRKITVGIFPGPSILLFITTGSSFVSWVFGRVTTPFALGFATVSIFLYLGFRTVAFLGIRARHPRGRRVPLPNPLQWIIIDEDEISFLVTRCSLTGRISTKERFEKYINTDSSETERFLALPEIRRLKFHSYITSAEKTRSEFIFSDPLREKGYFRYPPDFLRSVIPIIHGPDLIRG